MGGASTLFITGYNPSVSTTASTVWSQGSTSYAQLTAGAAMEAVSSSANDAAAGTGARTIRIEGLDGNYLPFAETITLNGVTPVPLANTSVIAINRVYVLTAGSGLVNAGNVDVRVITGPVIKARIQALAESRGESAEFVYTTAASQYGWLKKIQSYARTSTGDIWVFLEFFNSSGVRRVKATGQRSLDNTGFSTGNITIDFGDRGLYVPEKTLVTLSVDVSAGTPLVSAVGELELHAG